MVTLEQTKLGLEKYVESEFVSKVPGIKKVGVVLATSAIISWVEQKIITNKDIIVAGGFMTSDNMVDIDKVYTEVKKVFDREGKLVEHLPLFEDVTFTVADVDKVYKLIKGE